MNIQCLAFDLGASGGRLMLGDYDGGKIRVSEIYRFENEMARMNGVFYWDIYRLFSEMKKGLAKAAGMGVRARSVGIDTWGVDYGLLDKNDNLIGMPIAYRDARTEGCIGEADKAVGLDRIYSSTGIQFMNFNTLFQLMADKKMRPAIYDNADKLLFMPDLFGFLMTGIKYNEYTIMSTGQVLDARTKKLDSEIMDGLGLRSDLFCDMVGPGTRIGRIPDEIKNETGIGTAELIAVASHDTASAVAGTPFENPDAAFLSSGTWSLLGVETGEPIISPESFAENFTNEGGAEGSIRFLKNINGMWIIQQLKKNYGVSFGEIIEAAENSERRHFSIEPNDKRFTAPEDMRAEIIAYCEEAGMGRPSGLGEEAIAVYNGLAAEYKINIEKLEMLTGKKISCVNMIGGGIRDRLICGMTAKATGKKVIAGPVEGSVFGNIVMQLIALGELRDLNQGRRIINESCEKTVYYYS